MADSTYLGISMSTGRPEVMSVPAAVVVRWISLLLASLAWCLQFGRYSQEDVLLSTFALYHGKHFAYRFEAVDGCQDILPESH
jgi:hypothetical protein